MSGKGLSQLARQLRRTRERLGLTLAQVAARTGLSVSMLSKVENGKTQLTYDKILQLARGLSIDVSELFSESSGRMLPGCRVVNRAADAQFVSTPNYEYCLLSSELSRKRLIPIYAVNKARSLDEFDQLISHAGEEFAYVIEGTVEFHSEAYGPVRLNAGDSIHFDSSMGHAYVSVGEVPARVISVCSNASMVEEIIAAADKAAPAPPAAPAKARRAKA